MFGGSGSIFSTVFMCVWGGGWKRVGVGVFVKTCNKDTHPLFYIPTKDAPLTEEVLGCHDTCKMF